MKEEDYEDDDVRVLVGSTLIVEEKEGRKMQMEMTQLISGLKETSKERATQRKKRMRLTRERGRLDRKTRQQNTRHGITRKKKKM